MSFRIVRRYLDENYAPHTVRRGLTLEEAQAHCRNPETSSSTAKHTRAARITAERGPWFDGYEEDRR